MINYNELKPKSNRIIVTGPHFSGTELCAKALANDLGYAYHDAESEDVTELLDSGSHFVLNAPGLCHRVHMLNGAIIMMVRPFAYIVIDEVAANWTGRKAELQKYDAGQRHKIISVTKYDFWYRFQRSQIAEAYEVDYYSVPGANK